MTLLEMMVAISLFAVAGTFVSLQIGKGIEEKKFQSNVDRLHAELEFCRRQALNMQADWIVTLEKTHDSFFLSRSCPEMDLVSSAHWKGDVLLSWNGQLVNQMHFHFSATGTFQPKGLLEIKFNKKKVSWQFPDLFGIFEEKIGPGDLPPL